MTIHECHGNLIESSVLSDGIPGSDGSVVEFWDLTPGGRGEMLHVRTALGDDLTVDLIADDISPDFVSWAVSIARTELAGV